MEWVFGIVLLALAGVSYLFQQGKKREEQRAQAVARAARRERLASQYAGSPRLDDILNGTIRLGMTMPEVIDAWGQPDAVEERVLKTKVVQTLKYGQVNARTFRQHVKFENGVVVGWTNR